MTTDPMTPHPQGNGKLGDVAESEPVAWMTMAPQTAPLVSAAFLRERPEFRNIYTIPLYATPQPAIPPGFKVVPVEPTQAMLDVADKLVDEDPRFIAAAYRAMLSAAPVPEAGQGVSDDSVAVVMAIVEHIEGWKSATYGWQDDPVLEIAVRNREAATQAHAAECIRRIRAALLSPAPAQATRCTYPDCACAGAGDDGGCGAFPGDRWKAAEVSRPQRWKFPGVPCWEHDCMYSTGTVLLAQGAKCTNCGATEAASPPPQSAQLIEPVPDAVWEALQRLIENATSLGPASQEDAIAVARWRGQFVAAREGLMEGKDAVREVEFELQCNGEFEASASGPREAAWREIQHYAAQYAADGLLTIYEVTRTEIPLSQGQQTEPGSRNG